MEAIEFLIAARRFDRPLEEGSYYRFDGAIVPREGPEDTMFFPDEDYSVNVGTNFVRPMCLANTLTINSRGVATEIIHHLKEEIVFQNIVITALHREWDPAVSLLSLLR